MSDSLLLFRDHNDSIQLLDPDEIPASCASADEMQKILLELLIADCSYLALDTYEFADGRRVIGWSFRASTPQGVLLHDLFEQAMRGVSPPTLSRVLEMLAVSQPDEKEAA